LQERLQVEGLRIVKAHHFDHPTDRVCELRVKGPARRFKIAHTELASRPEVKNVFFD